MGILYLRLCGHCKHLSENVTCGICEATSRTIKKTGDNEFAKECALYENKYGYGIEENKEQNEI